MNSKKKSHDQLVLRRMYQRL